MRFHTSTIALFVTTLAAHPAHPAPAGDASPEVLHGTYFGGPDGTEWSIAMDIDEQGFVYIAGHTDSADMPGRLNEKSGHTDAFVAKLTPDLTGLVWSRYVGGTGPITSLDVASDIAAYPGGGCVISGHTETADFPTLNAAQPEHAGGWDAFVTRLDADGAIVFSTFWGGSEGEQTEHQGVPGAYGEVEVAPNGDIVIAGDTRSDDFPTVNAFYDSPDQFFEDAFVARFTPDGQPVFSTLLGDGFGTDRVHDMRIADDGGPVIVGTGGDNWPEVPGSFTDGTFQNNSVMFATKLSPDGQSLAFSVKVDRIRGDGGSIRFEGMDLGPDGSVWISGNATTGDALVPPTAYQPEIMPGSPLQDAVFYRFSADGTDLLGATYVGNRNGGDTGPTLAVDSQGRGLLVTDSSPAFGDELTRVDPLLRTADVMGEDLTSSGTPRQFRVDANDNLVWSGPNLTGITTPDAFQPDSTTGGDVYAAVVDPDGTSCQSDLVSDGVLDLADVQMFIEAFTNQDPPADFNADGVFDLADVQAFAASFQAGCP